MEILRNAGFSPLDTERVLHLEADLRRSEMTIQGLQQELAATKLAQTPTTDTQRYQLGGGGGARGQRSTPPPEVHRRSMEELAAIVTGTSVAKGSVHGLIPSCMYHIIHISYSSRYSNVQ